MDFLKNLIDAGWRTKSGKILSSSNKKEIENYDETR